MRIASRCWKRPLLVAVAIALVAFLALFVGPKFELSGVVSGVEFSPDLMKHRSFWHFSVLGIQVTPTQQQAWRSSINEHLISNGYAVENSTESPRWRFVKGFKPGTRGWHGRAKHACQGLGCYGGDDRWVEWSEANPELTRIIWPKVVEWLRNERDDEVYQLFRMSGLEEAKTVDEVQTLIRKAEVEAKR